MAPASLFVVVLGASTYAFARATLGQHLANWIDCHVRAFVRGAHYYDPPTNLLQ